MNDTFADALANVFRQMAEFQDAILHRKVPDLAETRQRFVRSIDRFTEVGRTQPDRANDYALAKGALVYWIDEMLTLHSEWTHAEDFRAVCLELHYPELKDLKQRSFGERPLNGPYFFYDFAKIAAANDEPDSLETFLLCVGLGFRGMLDNSGDEINEWAHDNYNRVRQRLRRHESTLRLDSTGPDSQGQRLQRLRGQHLFLGVSLLVATTAIVTLIGFLAAVHARPY